jgi:3-dehydroquinate dehydratase type I
MICISIIARNPAEAVEKMKRAEGLADIVEIRLDLMQSFDVKELIEAASKLVLVTYRSEQEGGRGRGDANLVTSYLTHALKAGADYVDVEFRMPTALRHEILKIGGPSRVILSSHLPDFTPSSEILHALLKRMAGTGAELVKIVSQATKPEDNLRILDLIPMATGLGVKAVAFCMGPMGRISRVACPLLGGFLTFASLERGEESAAGQIPAPEMQKILAFLSETH